MDESEVASLSNPLAILGEPGIGKTMLTQSLESTLGGKRVTAGTFSRSENLDPYIVTPGTPLIIDGLDEISANSGEPALDRVLSKLDRLGHPRFIVSCRAADWQGVTDRWRIEQDYGLRPVTLHILPFDHMQAQEFLGRYDDAIDPETLLNQIFDRGLQELAGNPLTLGLLAEVSLADAGLPESKTQLLESASRLLVIEKNPAHMQTLMAQARIDDLLLSAGAISAHLLITGLAGVAAGPRDSVPVGFVHHSGFDDIQDAALAKEILRCRLFRSDSEGLFVPLHRVIAEYLGARWLSRRLQAGLSERRLLQTLEFGGGIPRSLRGLHAWLAHFTPSLTDRCISADPYGVLRYGETNQLPVPRARHLLRSLAALAEDDPYFRSEDWGSSAVSGLARKELKAEIVSIIRSPDRHFHLSSLLLESLPGSILTKEIIPELIAVVMDSQAAYAERQHATDALIAGVADIDWPSQVAQLHVQAGANDIRLAIHTATQLKGDLVAPAQIADLLVDGLGIDVGSEEGNIVFGAEHHLVGQLSPKLCARVLDAVVARINAVPRPRHWTPTFRLTAAMGQLTAKALSSSIVSAEQFWSWVRVIRGRSTDATHSRERIGEFLKENTDFRRQVQRLAIADEGIDDRPWMAIVQTLPAAHPALAITADDTCLYLEELLAKDQLSDKEVILWSDLVRALGRPQSYTAAVSHCIRACIGKHRVLEEKREELNRPPDRDWEAEERRRHERYERQRAARFAAHRESFAKAEAAIAAGTELGALHNLALGYLDRYADLDSDATPEDRLWEWVGGDVAKAARKGFIAVLKRNDLPTIDQIVAIRSEGKHWTVEPVMTCGVAELVRTGQSLDCLSDKVAKAVLAIWWDMPEFGSSKLGEDIATQLEARVFTSAEGIESFLVSTIEPQIWASRDHVSGLYRLSTDTEFKDIAAPLALRWLEAVPTASLAVQHELVLICLHRGMPASLVGVVRNRLIDLSKSEDKCRRLWVAVAFIVGLPEFQETVAATAQADGSLLWAIRDLARPDRFDSKQLSLNVTQLAYIVEKFSPLWPVTSHPSSGWSGDSNPWDATAFINSCIDELGTMANAEASMALNRLVSTPSVAGYANRVKHVRAEQRRLRRDREYVPPSFDQVKRTLASGAPGTIDDLKALMMDALFALQDYIRNADTDGWEAFWLDDRPKVENTCRDRILDGLRPRVPKDVDLLPESLMPEKRRTDVLAIHDGKGLPIEVKGQWHRDVWNARATQLEDEQSRDWRADGRGIYLVLWAGHVSQKRLPRHPDRLPPPQSPTELRAMLQNQLDEGERRVIEVFVLDISRPPERN